MTETMTSELADHGLRPGGPIHWNQPPAELYEYALRRDEGELAATGAFATRTGAHTGRSPDDRFVVREPEHEADIAWGGVNVPVTPEQYERLERDVLEHLNASDELFARDVFAGADPQYRLPVRFVSTHAWYSLFVHNMFRRPTDGERERAEGGYTILHAPFMAADPDRHGTNSDAFVVINFAERTVLIGGTKYAGEIKKSIFSVLNYSLPREGVLTMHCSANQGEDGDVAVFFGLSGTGKTTLSTDPDRCLIGDDEQGWSDDGVFNIEGGNYAKVIRLSAEGEPLIWDASRRFGTILENVVVDPESRAVEWDDDRFTENTRSSYPLDFIEGAVPSGQGGHPNNILLLTADAFGVLPPIARLTREQAMYHFLSGYTAKVAGTEAGVTEPKATFSACFGEPFLPHPPSVYAELLGEKIDRHGVQCWLVNTGWTGGAFGEGHRMPLEHTRAMVRHSLGGELDDVPTREDPVFGLRVPERVPDVPEEVLTPRETWSDTDAYDAQAEKLAGMFRDNFRKFADNTSDQVVQAGP